jgi:GntR family transcriptional repressor for pyruvate dehydrogenase complex
MDTGYQPIKIKRTFEIIVDLIKEKIFSGEYQIGDRLPTERELSEMIEVSRNAVREAYHALEVIGIVEIRRGTGGGTFISDSTHRPITQTIRNLIRLRQIRLDEIAEARMFLEKDIAVLAVERATEEDIEKLEAWQEKAIKQNDAKVPAHKENVGFHLCLAEIARNPILMMVYSSVMDLFLMLLHSIPSDLEAATIMTEDHRKIISLLKARNKEELMTFVDSHIQGSYKRLRVLSKHNQFALSDAEKEINALGDILSIAK